MTEHYTKATVEVSAWCRGCGKATRHRVSHGRLGACLDCEAKSAAKSAALKSQAPKAHQEELFK